MEYKIRNTPQSRTEYHEWLSPVQTILLQRGFTLDKIEHYLNTTDEDILSPLDLDNMERGADMLLAHIARGSKIFIQVDSDCDGYTSAAMMINYLRNELKYDNIVYKLHEDKVHGILSADRVPKDCSLAIIPDASSNEQSIHKELVERGCSVLVLDHHHAIIDDNSACIINNQTCDYENKDLSGVGIVYKFCSYIDSLKKTEGAADRYLDLVAVGIIADVMKLTHYETRQLIKKGLSNFNNPFLDTFQKKHTFNLSDLNPTSVSWYLSPFINAVTRVGDMEDKTVLFRAMLEADAHILVPSTKRGEKGKEEELVTQAVRLCTNVKNRQKNARDEMLAYILNVIEEKELDKNQALIVPITEVELNKNLTGLIANQLVGQFKKPVLIVNERPDEETGEIFWMGSGRNANTSAFQGWKTFIKKSGFANFAEGHENAFGVSFSSDKLEPFNEYCNEKLKDYTFTNVYNVDFAFTNIDFSPDTIMEIAEYEHIWGQGVEKPFVLLKNVGLTKQNCILNSPYKRPTLKIKLGNQVDCIKFGFSIPEYKDLITDEGVTYVDIVGECSINEWMGAKTPQIKIVEYDVQQKQEYIF